MENKSKIFAQFSAGVFGGTTLGLVGFLGLMSYGGNYGCSQWIDSLFGTAGYESCGSFGWIAGGVIGVVLGIAIVSKAAISNYIKTAIRLLFATFLFPFLYAALMFWPPFEDSDILIAIPVILISMAFASIPSLLITAAINWRKFQRKIS